MLTRSAGRRATAGRVAMFVRGAVAGGVGAAVVIGATSALAGTGIGGVFNLGQTNTVNGKSALVGTEAAPGLAVTNSSTATGATALSLTAGAGKPPLTVSNSTLVANLDANYLQGRQANSLNRIGLGFHETLIALGSTETDARVPMTVPAAGFVKVEATFTATDAFSSGVFCNICTIEARLHDDVANADSPAILATFGNGTQDAYAPITLQWVFKASQGAHSYALTTGLQPTGGPARITNPVITAHYIPFGSTGSTTALAAKTTRRIVRTGSSGHPHGSG